MSNTETEVERAPVIPIRVSLTELEGVESEVDHQHCLVCYSDLSHPGILPCNHNEICAVCHLRLRHLHGNTKCPICKEEQEKIIADTPGKQFHEYPMWGDELGSNYIYRQNVGMFFPTDFYETEIDPLFGYQCIEEACHYDGTLENLALEEEETGANGDGNSGIKRKKKIKPATPLRCLQDHLRVEHRLTLCQLCVDNKRDFIARLPRMAPYQLKKHLTKGDGPGSGFEGHPVCEFCRPKRFYDLTHLHMHLQKEHYKCHICQKQGQDNQYFRNYRSLEKHFDLAHFMCPDAQCVQARFVVFENEIDLQHHERHVHGRTSAASSKIQLEFRTRRLGHSGDGAGQQRQEAPSEEDFNFGLAGEAFVPESIPQRDELTLHPMHLRRTAELRAQAAQIREEQEVQQQAASFPTLQEATVGRGVEAGVGQQSLNIGWASGTVVQRVTGSKKNAGLVTATDFPALPSVRQPRSAAGVKFRAGSNRHNFAAMQGSAGGPAARAASRGGWGTVRHAASAALATTPNPYKDSRSAFPVVGAVATVNCQEDLAADNFPVLGGGKKKAATMPSLVKKNQPPQLPLSWHSNTSFPGPPSKIATKEASALAVSVATPRQAVPTSDSFPALPGGAKIAKQKSTVVKKDWSPRPPPSWNNALDFSRPAPTAPPPSKNDLPSVEVVPVPKQSPPSLNSQTDFPAPLGVMKQTVVNNQKHRGAAANVTKATPTIVYKQANPQAMIQEMQASLGTEKYKKLKKFTRQFAAEDLAPDVFVNHAAALFDDGYADPAFWKSIPALVSSMPAQASVKKALLYMESLRVMKTPSAASVIVSPSVANNRPTRFIGPDKKSGGWGEAVPTVKSQQTKQRHKAGQTKKKKGKVG